MIIRLLIILLLQFASFILCGQSKNDIKELSKYLDDMIPIKADYSLTSYPGDRIISTEKDTLLILTYNHLKYNVPDFMISNHEVTNFEYRQFVNWVIDSVNIKNGIKAYKKGDIAYAYINDKGHKEEIKIYPDTLSWITDYVMSYNEALASNYFQNEYYNDFPVVGVSYDQANAYMHWLNEKLKLFLRQHDFEENLCYFRLPAETEWQYAATSKPSNGNMYFARNLYPWSGRLMDTKTAYKANYGVLMDNNNLYIKDACDDGYCQTSSVKSFEKNYFGIYDMAGNVSEWVSDTISVRNIEETMIDLLIGNIPNEIGVTFKKVSSRLPYYQILTKKPIDSITKKIVVDEFLTFNPDWKKINDIITDPFIFERLQGIYENGDRDIKIIKKYNRPGIIKGGSYNDAPIYMISCLTQIFPQTKGSSRTGFRVAMSMQKEMWEYLK